MGVDVLRSPLFPASASLCGGIVTSLNFNEEESSLLVRVAPAAAPSGRLVEMNTAGARSNTNKRGQIETSSGICGCQGASRGNTKENGWALF